MSRVARRISETGLYHIIFRGNGKQNIFEEEADYEKLKEILKKVKQETGMKLYAYCFMSNHAHLFIKEEIPGEISRIMSKILGPYATWFNKKYQRVGALFANRYKSEPVEDDEYFLGLTRYILQNPVKAKMVKSPEEYEYSSYGEYKDNIEDITDIDFLLDMIDENRTTAISEFIGLCEVELDDDFDINESRKRSSAEVRRLIKKELGGREPFEIKAMEMEERSTIVKKLVEEIGISKSEIERATGISRWTIIRICRGVQQKLPRPQTVAEKQLPTHLM